MSKRFFVLAIFLVGFMTLVFVPRAFDALFALIFVGIVPVTGYNIPPLVMLGVYIALIVLGIVWMISQSFIVADPKKRDQISRQKARSKVTKKAAPRSSSRKTRKRYQQTAKA